MPKSWSNKRERQYEHIKQSAKRRGRSTKRAKEIAAATVNKQRRKKGETSGGKKSRGTTKGRSRRSSKTRSRSTSRSRSR